RSCGLPGPAAPGTELAPATFAPPRRAGKVASAWTTRFRNGRKLGDLTARTPVERAKSGCKTHVLCEQTGLPLTVLISDTKTHDSRMLLPLGYCVAPIRQPRGVPGASPASSTPTRPRRTRLAA